MKRVCMHCGRSYEPQKITIGSIITMEGAVNQVLCEHCSTGGVIAPILNDERKEAKNENDDMQNV